jgi:hypothetical protein
MRSVETEPPPPQPSPKNRRRSGLFIGVVLLLQFLIPLTYLTREDADDDRFTWRTLSAPGAPVCQPSASLQTFDGRREELALEKLIHRDWVDYVGRNRRAVVDAFLKKQCETEGVLEVELTNRCQDDHDIREYRLRCGGERSHETSKTAAR